MRRLLRKLWNQGSPTPVVRTEILVCLAIAAGAVLGGVVKVIISFLRGGL
jgi:hypothetical protein